MDDSFFEINNFQKPKTLEEMNQQIGLLCDAIEKCEMMMQQMAASGMTQGGSADDVKMLLSRRMRLVHTKKDLTQMKNDFLQLNRDVKDLNSENDSEIAEKKSDPKDEDFLAQIKNIFRYKRKKAKRSKQSSTEA